MNTSTESAREDARQGDGKFGEQHQAAADPNGFPPGLTIEYPAGQNESTEGVSIPDGMVTFGGLKNGDPITSGVFIRVERFHNETHEQHDVLLGPYPSEAIASEMMDTGHVDAWCDGGRGSYAYDDDVHVADVTVETIDDIGGLEVAIPDAQQSVVDRLSMMGSGSTPEDVTFEIPTTTSAAGTRISIRNEFVEEDGLRKGKFIIVATDDAPVTGETQVISTRQEISYDNRRGIDNQGGESAAIEHASRVVLTRLNAPRDPSAPVE